MKKLLLIGEKINESLSPAMHNAALKHMSLDSDYKYELFPIKPENFDVEMQKLKSDKELAGFNVTMPYKTDILKFVDETDAFTKKCGACNYVKVEKGLWSGRNTDGYGFIMPLAKRNISVKGSTMLFFGAGGAARAAILQCINNGAEQIIVINRTPERAVSLREQIIAATGFEPNNFLIYSYNELKNNELRCIILDGGVTSIR
ncbi:MAG TPA: NAD(P)-binding domain-containing protein, partial [Candidatus Wallbacteria bacterium]|nr:NAD(P)-binding domain-containing protein [Candidatus Wallbacteria bacterium]